MYRETELSFTHQREITLCNLGNINIISAPGVRMGLGSLVESLLWSHRAFLAIANHFPHFIPVFSDSLWGMVANYPIAWEWSYISLIDVYGKSTHLSVRRDGDYSDGRLEFTLIGEENWRVFFANGQATMLTRLVDPRIWWVDFEKSLFVPNNRDCYPLDESTKYPSDKLPVLIYGRPAGKEKLAEELLCRFRANGQQVFWLCYGSKDWGIEVEEAEKYTIVSYTARRDETNIGPRDQDARAD